jgi:peptide/nickel transport system ATP-binding protein
MQVDGLTIGYHNRAGDFLTVLREVSLTVAAGETVGIVGESGCGKSTLALALLGYLRRGSQVASGSVCFGGSDLFALTPDAQRRIRGGRIALIPQNAGQSLTPTLRIGRQIGEALRLHTSLDAAAIQARTLELLAQVRLPDLMGMAQRYPHQISGGQQQRVAIAMALAGAPELLILDEPTTGLDVTTQAHLLDLLAELSATHGTTMVYISHDLGVIARACDRVAVMYAGEIVEAGAAAWLFAHPVHPYTQGLLASVPSLRAARIPAALPGQPPRIGALAEGCAFAPRCRLADVTCRTVSPALMDLTAQDDRQVRCHHHALAAADIAQETTALARSTERLAAPHEPLLALEAVSLSYEKPALLDTLRCLVAGDTPSQARPVVRAVSLTVRRGETLALVGESGSGKSTVVRAIAGLLLPLNGSITFEGVDLKRLAEARPAAAQRAIQMIFQNPDASLNPRHTVAELLAQPLRLYFGLSRKVCRDRAAALLEQVRLGAHYLDRYPAQLSGGEKQRVAIARAFAAEPTLVLCDEVTSALDVSVQAAVLQLLADLQRQYGTTYIFISHDLAVVRSVADYVAVMQRGEVCDAGTVEEVFSPPFHPYTEVLMNAVLEPKTDAPAVHEGARV